MPTAVMRRIVPEDLDGLVALSEQATFGLTTLPKDRDLLAARIRESEQGFAKIAEKPRGESYLFVLEDLETHEVVGTSGIISKVGGFEPFYAYAIETKVHESKTLRVHKEIRTLHLVRDHDGPCEIGSLFLSPNVRASGYGRLLSLGRFLFMAEHESLFDPVVIAEMRGVVDEHGSSPFWEAVGRHFFDVDFPTADYLSVVDKKFIAELMPEHPVYIPLLPAAAQEVIGRVHPSTAPARKMLEDEGFVFSGMVDIFEAGPILRCALGEIRSVRESVEAPVVEITAAAPDSDPCVLGNNKRDFRACLAAVDRTVAGGVRLGRDAARALGVAEGDDVRFVSLRPRGARRALEGASG